MVPHKRLIEIGCPRGSNGVRCKRSSRLWSTVADYCTTLIWGSWCRGRAADLWLENGRFGSSPTAYWTRHWSPYCSWWLGIGSSFRQHSVWIRQTVKHFGSSKKVVNRYTSIHHLPRIVQHLTEGNNTSYTIPFTIVQICHQFLFIFFVFGMAVLDSCFSFTRKPFGTRWVYSPVVPSLQQASAHWLADKCHHTWEGPTEVAQTTPCVFLTAALQPWNDFSAHYGVRSGRCCSCKVYSPWGLD